MIQPNFLVLALSALIPLIVGFVWYNNAVFGKVWMRTAGLTPEQLKGGNMLKIFGLTYLLGFFFSIGMMLTVIHQFHILSLFTGQPGFPEPGADSTNAYNSFMAVHGQSFRKWTHGATHGFFAAIEVMMPILGINALFERKSFTYFAVHLGYWIVTMMLMGAVICQFN